MCQSDTTWKHVLIIVSDMPSNKWIGLLDDLEGFKVNTGVFTGVLGERGVRVSMLALGQKSSGSKASRPATIGRRSMEFPCMLRDNVFTVISSVNSVPNYHRCYLYTMISVTVLHAMAMMFLLAYSLLLWKNFTQLCCIHT